MRAERQQVRNSASPPPFPEVVGSYELLLPIASGGMGTVYLARKRGPGGFEREVALKLTHPFLREQPDWTSDLIEEAKLASRIHHPNVVHVMDVEDDPYGVFLVMQYVEGESLEGLLRRARERGERIPVDVGLRILIDALCGLHAAHELRDPAGQPLGLVHRDFTPQNILVGLDGVARLTDFGVAKAASRVGVTRTGVVKGKAAYMAPEQVRSLPLDRRADVWAAGVVAWELFAGQRMRAAVEDQAALLLQVATDVPPRLRSVREDVPAAVDEAVAQALTLDRTRRCPSAARLSESLARAWAEGASPAEAAAVAEYVRAAAGASLAERRELAARVSVERSASRTSVAAGSWLRSKASGGSRARPLLAMGGAAAIVGAVWVWAGVVHGRAGPPPAMPASTVAAPPAPSAQPEVRADEPSSATEPTSSSVASSAGAAPAVASSAPRVRAASSAVHAAAPPHASAKIEPPLAKNPYLE
jgi:serine/threonine-protein kinase